MSLLQHPAAIPSQAALYEVGNSLVFSTDGTYADANSLMYHQISTGDGWQAASNAGTNARKLTVSCWFKRTLLTESSHFPRIFDYRAGGVAFSVFFNTSDQLGLYDDNTSMNLVSNRVFRDTTAWYHIVVQADSTQSTASDRLKVYINGVALTEWDTEDFGNQNVDLSPFRTTNTNLQIGGAGFDASAYFNGYITEYNFIDGSTQAHTEFGLFDSDTGIWIPKKYGGSYGTLGHYYNFSVASDVGQDFSGNDNDTTNRGSGVTNGAARQATDTCTNNFCIMNAVDTFKNVPVTYTDGGSRVEGSSGNRKGARGTVGLQKGKWYYEFKASGSGDLIGWSNAEQETAVNNNAHETPIVVAHSFPNGGLYIMDSAGQRVDTSYSGMTHSSSSIYSCLMNLDDDQITFQKDGTNAGTVNIDIDQLGDDDKYALPFCAINGNVEFNFGGFRTFSISSAQSDANGHGTFEHAPPSGYFAICTKNLAEYGG